MSSAWYRKANYRHVDSQTRNNIINEHRKGERGCGYTCIAKRHNLPRETVRDMIARAKSHNGESTQQRGHKPRLLTAREEQKIYNALDNNGSLSLHLRTAT